MDPLKKFQAYLNEEELPYFNDFEKQVLQYGLDHIGDVREGEQAEDVVDIMFNPEGDGIIIYNQEGIDILTKFNDRDAGSGWASALEYAFDIAADYDSTDYMSEKVQEGNWAAVADYIIAEMGRRLMVSSEILAQAIANNEKMTAEDIEDLKQELELFIS